MTLHNNTAKHRAPIHHGNCLPAPKPRPTRNHASPDGRATRDSRPTRSALSLSAWPSLLMEYCSSAEIINLLNSRLKNQLANSEILKASSTTVAAVFALEAAAGFMPSCCPRCLRSLWAGSGDYCLLDPGHARS
ncbi:hypothetical protein PtA15_6A614 [Puccinia triticina]|uniref:Uncharacterized protein n=1 Tax=Puccinia triticina TaxID=208348 RepID=A0ABY7CLF8_9BASI|nr:uncharacterized protein PtA15_6A614 [Puccinia triticina]WAQ85984.1 hypothetical protein PtA15_6A614 [Puccinia triticina]